MAYCSAGVGAATPTVDPADPLVGGPQPVDAESTGEMLDGTPGGPAGVRAFLVVEADEGQPLLSEASTLFASRRSDCQSQNLNFGKR